MSNTTWTGTGGGNWFTASSWSGGVPAVTSTGSEIVIISGAIGTQPTINPNNDTGATFFIDQQGFQYTSFTALTEVQIDGEIITLEANADLTIDGLAIGNFRGTSGVEPHNSVITNLTAANGITPEYDTHMLITISGADTLTDHDDNENFGEILVGSGGSLNLTISPGGNTQPTHTFYNYGLIEVNSGGLLEIGTAAANGTTVSGFANPGWIRILGGSLVTSAEILDDANAGNGPGTPDGYIEIGSGGFADLQGSVVSTEAVVFLDGSSDTLGLSNGNIFSGSISSFGTGDSISVYGATGTPVLTYSGTNLILNEENSAGSVTNSITLDIGSGYSSTSFVALLGSGGVVIETPQTAEQHGFTFQGTSIPSNFEDYTQYKALLAPGSDIQSGETVTIIPASLATLTTSLLNNGEILLDGVNANFEAFDPVSGSGVISLSGGAIFDDANTSGVTTNEVSFGSGGNILSLIGAGTTAFGGTIYGMNGNDIIDIGNSVLPTPTSASNISLSFSGGILTINDTVGGVDHVDTLSFGGTVPGSFTAAVTGGVIQITDVPCFAAGTRILTPDGDALVQNLRAGDEVLTVHNGGDTVQKIIWAGHRTVDLARHPNPEKVAPVRILAGALATGLPERDLIVSPDHCLLFDGHLIEAKILVNGATVIQDMSARTVTYHHIELAQHGVVLAEGVPAETYLDSGNRAMFEGGATTVLHPDFAATSRENACAPLVLTGPVVLAVRQRLLERAVALGFAATAEIDLAVKAGVEKLLPTAASLPKKLLFELSQPVREVELLSSTGVPAHLGADPDDRRVLGAAITSICLIANGKRHKIALDDAAHRGFHAMETGHRWTNGAARITLPMFRGSATLEIKLHGQAVRWAATRKAAAISA